MASGVDYRIVGRVFYPNEAMPDFVCLPTGVELILRKSREAKSSTKLASMSFAPVAAVEAVGNLSLMLAVESPPLVHSPTTVSELLERKHRRHCGGIFQMPSKNEDGRGGADVGDGMSLCSPRLLLEKY